MTHHRPEDDETTERLDPGPVELPPDPPADPNAELVERDETDPADDDDEPDPVLPAWLSDEAKAEIRAAWRARPRGVPKGDGTRARPVWRGAGDDQLARPGPATIVDNSTGAIGRVVRPGESER